MTPLFVHRTATVKATAVQMASVSVSQASVERTAQRNHALLCAVETGFLKMENARVTSAIMALTVASLLTNVKFPTAAITATVSRVNARATKDSLENSATKLLVSA